MAQPKIYQLEIKLAYSNPPIWRRLLFPSDMELDFLHMAIQFAMGWDNYHMHSFSIRGKYYGDPSVPEDLQFENEAEFPLGVLVTRPRQKFQYEYDFGDSWVHEITLEKILDPEPGKVYPCVVDGEKACPPEDCGGIPGFYQLMQVVADKKHPEHRELSAWLGKYNPDDFEPAKANKLLAKLAGNPEK